jgi:hypothetical protein
MGTLYGGNSVSVSSHCIKRTDREPSIVGVAGFSGPVGEAKLFSACRVTGC